MAEAFHALPAGRSAGKHLDVEMPEQADQPREEPETPEESAVDKRPYEKKILEKKTKKATEIVKPIERR